ncbi:DUF5455 family protein [Pseudoalteromonas shioyasakiensis]|uniref:DUF5455 family protein n=1 Tax=Pseudoalteromonas shioyasakiensis TaxID=1190813 RepID=UPI001C3E4C5A|nr:DUF5455 family protein [Pseudoalteromonas shioyasakiensis]
MPAILAAIPAILAGLAAGITSIITTLLAKYGRKVVIGTIFITVYTAALVAFVSSLNSEFSGLLRSLPNNSFSLAGLSLVPNNAITCATIVVSAKAAQMVFYFTIGVLRSRFKA